MRSIHWKWTTWLVLAGLGSAGCEKEENDLLAAIEKRGTLRVATDQNYPPQSFLEDGEWKGFDIAVAKEIAKRLGVTLEPLHSEWQEVTSGNWGERWDINVGSMAETKTRAQVLSFAKPPYYYTPAYFGVSPESGVTTLAGLAGKTICSGAETTYESWLNGTLDDIPEERIFESPPANKQIVTRSTENECLEAIATVSNNAYEIMIASQSFIDAAVADGKLIRLDPAVYVEDLCVATTKSHALDPSRLMTKIGESIAAMHKDGTLKALSEEWFDADLTQDPMTR